ncbi:MAG TPA: cation:dicarboxylase symporter family transporter, partial [Pedobacter sp.]
MSKNNRLTFFIFLALILGVILGYVLNVNSFDAYNTRIISSDNQAKHIDVQLGGIKDTVSVNYTRLKAQKKEVLKIKKENETVIEKKLEPLTLLSDIFLRLIKMIVAPLVFTTLVVGVAKVGDIKAVGRIGGKTMLWFVSASLLSLVLGLIMVNIFKPGEAMHLPLPSSHLDTGIQKTALSMKEFISHIVPKSMTEAMAANEILQIVVFSLFFGVATAAIGEKGKIVIEFFDAVAHVILKVTGYVMNFAPFAVFGA